MRPFLILRKNPTMISSEQPNDQDEDLVDSSEDSM